MDNPKERFSNRVADYRRFRPDYPPEVLRFLTKEVPPQEETTAADIGSGTGILSRQLLEAGYHVLAVEPNAAMREAAEADLGKREGFQQFPGSAEDTGLPSRCASLATAGQAFHWFDPLPARREFQRILKPRGAAALIWNDRDKTGSRFARLYEDLLRKLGTDYNAVDHSRHAAAKMRVFWAGARVEEVSIAHAQYLDREALHGRVASSSYTPPPGEKGYDELHRELDRIFDECQQNGTVAFEYATRVYLGRWDNP